MPRDFKAMPIVIHCADIGSVKNGNFGWARLLVDDATKECTTGHDILAFADGITADINAGFHVALGFECPLFVPITEDPTGLTSARPGEDDRPWSAGGGAGSLATGLTETVWILKRVGAHVRSRPEVFDEWSAFIKAQCGLFVWEAFVSKDAKADTHHGDAELAALSFRSALPDLKKNNAVVCEGAVRSLFGAALLQTGWVRELAWLSKACVVIRAKPLARSAA